MADEEKAAPEAAESTKNDAKAKKKGPSLLVLGGVGVGAIVIGIALALFVIGPMMSGSDEEASDESTTSASHDNTKADKKSDKHGSKKKDGHGGTSSLVYAVKDVVVNPAGTGGTRFLSVSFGFELASQELATRFEERELLVRDALITILSSKTVAELTNARQKEIVRFLVKKRLSQIFETEDLEAVYYTDFVLQ